MRNFYGCWNARPGKTVPHHAAHVRQQAPGPCQKTMHAVIAVFVAVALLSPAMYAEEQDGASVPKRPNIIWILLDACRPNMKCFGYERETSPNIDALAARGAVFEQHFAQGAVTVISVPTYMTGRYFPSPCIGEYGSFEEYTYIKLPHPRERLLPDVLRDNGYSTAMFTQAGVWFSNSDRLPRAFERFIGLQPKKPPLVTFEEVNAAVAEFLEQPLDKPFFLYLHTWDTHFPHHLTPPYDCWIDPAYDKDVMEQSNTYNARRKDGQPFDEADIAYLRALYDGSILYADAQIGKLIQLLDNKGILENTVFIIGADHGETLGEDGKTVGHVGGLTFDEITRVPLVVSGPGVPAGARVTDITENIDIFPTLVELLGLKTDAAIDGASLLPLMREDDIPAPHVYAFTKAAGMHDLISMRGGEFRFDYHIPSGRSWLYPLPDNLVSRKDVIKLHTDIADEMKRVLMDRMAPRWRERERLPMMAAFLTLHKHLAPGDAGTQPVIQNVPGQHPLNFGQDDGKWLLFQGQLFAASFAEDAAPLEIRTKIENGSYRVLLEMFSAADYGGHPASSATISLPGDTSPRVIESPPVDEPKGKFVYADLGTIAITDGTFAVTLDDGHRDRWTGLKSIVLVAQSGPAQAEFNRLFDYETRSQDEIRVNIEQLDALGYMDTQ